MKMEVLRPLELDFDSYDVTLVCEDEQEEGGGAIYVLIKSPSKNFAT